LYSLLSRQLGVSVEEGGEDAVIGRRWDLEASGELFG
jgi:hypothetical protein